MASSVALRGPAGQSDEWDKASLGEFVSSLGVASNVKQKVANKLFEEGYTTEASLLAATQEDIQALELPTSAFRLMLEWCKKRKKEKNCAPELVKVVLEFGNSKNEMASVERSHVSFDFLSKCVKETWEEFDIAEFDMLVANEKLSAEATLNFPLTVTVKSRSQGFASFTRSMALSYAKVQRIDLLEEKEGTSSFPHAFDIKDDCPTLLHAVNDLELKHKLYNPLDEGCEYTRREFISAIVVLAATLAGVKLACEEKIEGSLGNGPVDWVALYQEYRFCITEGKKDNLSHGVTQNLAQLAAVGEGCSRKRKFTIELPLYGIATTYKEWAFIKLVQSEPRQAVRIPNKDISESNLKLSVKAVAGVVAGIFKAQKEMVDKLLSHRLSVCWLAEHSDRLL